MIGNRRLFALAVAVLLLTGCASVTQGTEQHVRVDTVGVDGAAIAGAECELQNDKGSANVLSGGGTLIRRSGGNLTIRCTSGGKLPAVGQAVSRANAGLAGNIVLGGGIGAAIDVSTGAAYTYPTWVQLVFGEERLYDRSGNRDDSMSAGTFVRATVADASTRTAAAAKPPPVPAADAPRAVADAAPPAGPTSPLRRGDTLEYALVDQLTGKRAPVYYRVDRIEGDRLVFNQGSRVEMLDGRVVSVSSPVGGLFDSSSPPGGWGRRDLRPGMRWRAEYPSSNGETARFELDAAVEGHATFTVEGVTLNATRIKYTGWMYATAGVGPVLAFPFQATALYASDLGRVVKFEAQYRRASLGLTNESLELTRVLR
jgi:hypothetical protein